MRRRIFGEDDDDEILKDGESLAVSVMMLDELQRAVAADGAFRRVILEDAALSPNQVTLTDQERQRRMDQVEAYNKRVSNAWRSPLASDERTSALNADAETRHAAYERWLTNAWRGQ